MKREPINLKAIEAEIRAVAQKYGLPSDRYEVDKAADSFKENAVRLILGEFTDANGLSYSEDDKAALLKLNTEAQFKAYLEKKYPAPADTRLDQIIEELRLASPEYWVADPEKGKWSRRQATLEEFTAELASLNKKFLKTRLVSYGSVSVWPLRRLAEWCAGEQPESQGSRTDEDINAGLKGVRIKSYANGRVDVYIADEKKKAELLARYNARQLERFRRFLADK